MTKARFVTSLVLAGIIISCSGKQPQVAIPGQEKTLTIQASSFSFEPNNIRANAGDMVVLNITNTSKSAHNFTIKDPHDKVLQSVDLPPNKTVPVTVSLTESGIYNFFCNKPFHSTMGMKGMIDAGPASQ